MLQRGAGVGSEWEDTRYNCVRKKADMTTVKAEERKSAQRGVQIYTKNLYKKNRLINNQ